MRFISFLHEKRAYPGVLVDDSTALDLSAAAGLRSVLQLIELGDEGLELVHTALQAPQDNSLYALGDLHLLSPLPVPQQIRDFANYEKHCLRAMDASMRLRASNEADPEAAYQRMKASGAYTLPKVWYDIPLYYKGNRFAANGHEGNVEWPPFAESLDYELELAAVIGKQGKDIGASDAREHIFGYTIFNDFSARDIQARWEGQFRMGPCQGQGL